MTRSKSALSLLLLVVVMSQGTVAMTPQSGPATGPLRRHPSNGRYFTDGSGKAVYLTGSHSWDVFQYKWWQTENPGQYFDLLQANGHNFMRLWIADSAWSPVTNLSVEPQPYVRTGPGNAADGQPRFDLNQLNQNFFNQLRNTVITARDRGIYVSVMFFNSWGAGEYWWWPPNGDAWLYSPFRSTNNVNGINGDPNGDGVGFEVHSLQIPAITRLQEAYIRKCVDSLNDLDNVLWEISNEEAGPGDHEWEEYLIGYVRNYEANKPRQHPIGMTAIWEYNVGVRNDWLYNSSADWISPAPTGSEAYDTNPPAANGGKVILLDTDHIGFDLNNAYGNRSWVWKSFTRGHNPLLMEDLTYSAGWIAARAAMGQSRSYANKMNLAAMAPQDGLSSTSYCLANPGSEYLVYQPGSDGFSVYLNAGTYSVEWFNTAAGSGYAAGDVTVSGEWKYFPPPFGEAVLYLKAVPSGNTNGAVFVSQSVPTSMGAGGTYSVSVTMQNTGTAAWTAAAGHRLGSQNPQDNGTWGTGRVNLGSGDWVGPGQQKTFTWNVTAPSSPGTYAFQWRMVQEWVEWFGDFTPTVWVTVSSTGTYPDLVGQWKFDEGGGGWTSDASGNGNDGTLVNAGWATGKSGSALSVDGYGYLSVPASDSLNSPKTGFTVAMWVLKRSDCPGFGVLAGRRYGPSYEDTWVLYYNYGDQDEYSFGVRTSSPVFITGPSSAGDAYQWVHVAGVYDGTAVRLYRNGVEVASAAQSGSIPNESAPLILGAGDNGDQGIAEYINAAMDDVRVYNRALSASEVQGLASGAGSSQAPPNLLVNPGFENGKQGWTGITGNRTIVSLGSQVLKIPASSTSSPTVSQAVAASAGKNFTASGRVKTDQLAAGAKVRVAWRNGSGSTLRTDLVATIQGTTDWVQISKTFLTPAGTTQGVFQLMVAKESDGAGTAWFDDVSLVDPPTGGTAGFDPDDVDGDGLLNEFELEMGLDPQKRDSNGDGLSDDQQKGADGRTLEAAQSGDAVPSSGNSGGGACGLLGVETLLVLGWAALMRRR